MIDIQITTMMGIDNYWGKIASHCLDRLCQLKKRHSIQSVVGKVAKYRRLSANQL